jgi:hypothetical protein
MIAELKATGASPDFDVKREWAIARLWEVASIRAEKNRPDLPCSPSF